MAGPCFANHLSVHAGLSGHRHWAVADLGESPLVIGSGDFNRDGIADLVEVTAGEPEPLLTVLLGRADGTFAPVASREAVGGAPTALVVGDFNGDGNSDVIVGDRDGALLEFAGDGRGNLLPARTIATFGSITSIAEGHFTRSGHLDLVVADGRSRSGVVLRGAGDGSFRPVWTFPLPKTGADFHLGTADFNGDGIPDLVISSDDSEDYEVMLGTGMGTFAYSPKYSYIRDPNSYCPS